MLYIAAMWIAGVMQGLMWRAVERRRHADLQLRRGRRGHAIPFYIIRLLGGLLFFSGMLIMAYNVWKTVGIGQRRSMTPPFRKPFTPERRHEP